MLTSRLEAILTAVVEFHIATGRPAGSKYISDSGDLGVSASTVRGELARLEAMGYLDHPHTSAGRVPTDKGYRYYVDHFSRARRRGDPESPGWPVEIGAGIEDALRWSAGTLARATGLLAMVSAPLQNNVAIKRVEVLGLQPDLVMVIVITVSGGIVKKLFLFDEPVDPGLIDWACGYLNEAFQNIDLGSRRLRRHLEGRDLTGVEAEFLKSIAPAFVDLAGEGGGELFLDGVSGFFTQIEQGAGRRMRDLMGLLDRQERILKLLNSAPMKRRVYLLIGEEMPEVALRGLSLVAANYGLGYRNLGAVGVLGPTRMDYENAIINVECAARSLSSYVGERFN